MSQSTLLPVSNRAGWTFTRELIDADTGTAIDLSSATFVFEVEDQLEDEMKLSATTVNGKVTVIDTGVFQVAFTAADMGTLCARTYKVGCTMTNGAAETQQLFIYSLPVLDGVVT